MKRREFLTKSSMALAAVAVSDLWVGKVMAGETTLREINKVTFIE